MNEDFNLAQSLGARQLIGPEHWEAFQNAQRCGDPRSFARFLLDAAVVTEQDIAAAGRARLAAPTLAASAVSSENDSTALVGPVTSAASVSSAADAVITSLGSYRVVGELGRGGFGVVYLGRGRSGEEVAIKLLTEADPEAAARFQREARLLALLGQEGGFVPLVDWGQCEAGHYIVMPFLPGGTLSERIKTGGPLEVDEAAALMVEVASALGRAHERGVIHRDIKPANILFNADDQPLIADLGLGKHFWRDDDGAQSHSLSVAGQSLGTVGFMAPEQMRDAREVGPAADVYSLGAVLYTMLAGLPPFHGGNPFEVAARASRGEIPAFSERGVEVPARLEALVRRCLSPDARDRPADGAQLAAELDELDEAPRAASAAGLLIVLAVAGLAAAAAWALWPRETTPKPAPESAPTPAPVEPVAPVSPEPPVVPAPRLAEVLAGRDPYASWREGRVQLRSVLGQAPGATLAMVSDLAFSKDGSVLASIGLERQVRLWDVATGALLANLASPAEGFAVAFTPDDRGLIAGGQRGWLMHWDLATGQLVRPFSSLEGRVTTLHVTEGGLLFAGTPSDLKVWRLEDGADVTPRHAPLSIPATCLAPIPGTTHLLAGGRDSLVRFDANTGQVIARWTIAWPGASDIDIQSLDSLPSGEAALLGSRDGQLGLWSFAEDGPRRLVQLCAPDPKARYLSLVRSVLCVGDGRALVGTQGHLRLLDLDSLKVVQQFPGHGAWTHTLAQHPDGERFASGGNDARLQLRAADGVYLWDRTTHSLQVRGLAASEDGRTLYSTGLDSEIRAWDLSAEGASRYLGSKNEVKLGACRVSATETRLAVYAEKEIFLLDLSGADDHKGIPLDPESRQLNWGWCGDSFALVHPTGITIVPFPEMTSRAFKVPGGLVGAALLDQETCLLLRQGGVLETFNIKTGATAPLAGRAFSEVTFFQDFGCGIFGVLERGAFFVWRVEGQAVRPVARAELTGSINGTAGASNGNAALLYEAGQVVVLPRTGQPVTLNFEPLGDLPTTMTFGADGRELFVGTRRGVIVRLEIREEE